MPRGENLGYTATEKRYQGDLGRDHGVPSSGNYHASQVGARRWDDHGESVDVTKSDQLHAPAGRTAESRKVGIGAQDPRIGQGVEGSFDRAQVVIRILVLISVGAALGVLLGCSTAALQSTISEAHDALDRISSKVEELDTNQDGKIGLIELLFGLGILGGGGGILTMLRNGRSNDRKTRIEEKLKGISGGVA